MDGGNYTIGRGCSLGLSWENIRLDLCPFLPPASRKLFNLARFTALYKPSRSLRVQTNFRNRGKMKNSAGYFHRRLCTQAPLQVLNQKAEMRKTVDSIAARNSHRSSVAQWRQRCCSHWNENGSQAAQHFLFLASLAISLWSSLLPSWLLSVLRPQIRHHLSRSRSQVGSIISEAPSSLRQTLSTPLTDNVSPRTSVRGRGMCERESPRGVQ